MIIMATILNTTQVAEKLETTPRTLRKFLRSPDGFDSKVGKGQRWSIEAKDMRSLTKRFNAWKATNEAKNEVDAPEAPETPSDDA